MMLSLSSTPEDLQSLATRTRLVRAAVMLFQRGGYHGTGVAEILTLAACPKGSLYHHFPGGKLDLAVAGVDWLVETTKRSIAQAVQKKKGPQAYVKYLVRGTARWLSSHDYAHGSLLATLAQEAHGEPERLHAAVADGYAAIVGALSDLIHAEGAPKPVARTLALTIVCAIDGAILQARAQRSTAPLVAAGSSLDELLRAV